jgi:hypothetical protein
MISDLGRGLDHYQIAEIRTCPGPEMCGLVFMDYQWVASPDAVPFEHTVRFGFVDDAILLDTAVPGDISDVADMTWLPEPTGLSPFVLGGALAVRRRR